MLPALILVIGIGGLPLMVRACAALADWIERQPWFQSAPKDWP